MSLKKLVRSYSFYAAIIGLLAIVFNIIELCGNSTSRTLWFLLVSLVYLTVLAGSNARKKLIN